MIIDQSEHLRNWLFEALQPLCDADPNALAKYVLALIRKDKGEDELKQCMIEQLDVFLQLETKGFVNRLFKVLKTKEYLPSTKPTPIEMENNSVSVNDDSKTKVTPEKGRADVNSENERANQKTVDDKAGGSGSAPGSASKITIRREDDERDRSRRNKSRSPARRSRSRGRKSRSPQYRPQRYRPKPVQKRYERDIWDRRRSPGARNRSASPRRTPPRYRRPFNNSRSRSRSPHRSPAAREGKDTAGRFVEPSVQDNKDTKPAVQSVIQHVSLDGKSETNKNEFKGIRCRDYDEKGLCMMGDLCPYDHGVNPVILEDVNAPLKQEEYQVDLSLTYPPPRMMRNRPMFGEGPVMDGSGWNPHFRPRHMMMMGRPAIRPGMMRYPQPPAPRLLVDVPVVGPPVPQPQDIGNMDMSLRGIARNSHPMRGYFMALRGRGRGGFDRARLGAKPTRNNCSLEVKKIPREQNSIMALNGHFWKFGKIINIQINFEGDPEAALVTFATPEEAYAAYKSTEAVMQNRFIRVFWHNKEKENEDGVEPEPGPAGRISVKDRLGEQQLESGEPMEEEKIIVTGNSLTKTVYNYTPTPKKELSAERAEQVEAIMKAQEMLAAQENLRKAQEEKKKEAIKLMHNLKSRKGEMLREQLEQQKKLINKLEENNLTMTQDEKSQLMSLITSLQESIESIKKDLDELSKPPVVAVPSVRNTKETQKEILDAELDLYNKELEGGDTLALQHKVYELRAQAHASGIFKRGRGGFRGSLRGLFGARGRGARLVAGSMRNLRSVDRRTTKICITGYPVSRHSDVLTHFGQFGSIESFEPNLEVPSLVINYANRKTAEVAMMKGKVFDDMNLDITWVANAKPSVAAPVENNQTNGQVSQPEEMDAAGSNEDDNDESTELYAEDQHTLDDQYDEDEEDDVDRSWRR